MSTIPHQARSLALRCVALRCAATGLYFAAWPATLVPRYLLPYIQLAAWPINLQCCRFRAPQGPSPLTRSEEPRVCRRQKLSRSLSGSRSRGCTPTCDPPPERDHHHSPRRQRERKTTTRSRLLLIFYSTFFLVLFHSILRSCFLPTPSVARCYSFVCFCSRHLGCFTSNLGFRGESIGHPYSIRLPPLAPSSLKTRRDLECANIPSASRFCWFPAAIALVRSAPCSRLACDVWRSRRHQLSSPRWWSCCTVLQVWLHMSISPLPLSALLPRLRPYEGCDCDPNLAAPVFHLDCDNSTNRNQHSPANAACSRPATVNRDPQHFAI